MWDIPIVGHKARERKNKEPAEPLDLASYNLGMCNHSIYIDPPKKMFTATWNPKKHKFGMLPFVIPGMENKGILLVYTWSGSILDSLYKLSEWLSKKYGWEVGNASWFVLTGDIPINTPLWVNTDAR